MEITTITLESLDKYLQLLYISKTIESGLLIILIALVIYLVFLVKSEKKEILNLQKQQPCKKQDEKLNEQDDNNKKSSKISMLPFKNFIKNNKSVADKSYDYFDNILQDKIVSLTPTDIIFSNSENEKEVNVYFCKQEEDSPKIILDMVQLPVEYKDDLMQSFNKNENLTVTIDLDFYKNGF